MKKEKVTTKDLEIAVVQYTKSAELRSLRTSLPWECDVLAISKSNLASEYELKITRSDFLADFKKPKHKKFERGEGGYISKFWYVVPEGLIKKKEVPDYAGLMYYRKQGKHRIVTPVKQPKTLRANKIDTKTFRRLYRSMMFRFLKLNFKDIDPNIVI